MATYQCMFNVILFTLHPPYRHSVPHFPPNILNVLVAELSAALCLDQNEEMKMLNYICRNRTHDRYVYTTRYHYPRRPLFSHTNLFRM